jgi:hypothetical protein
VHDVRGAVAGDAALQRRRARLVDVELHGHRHRRSSPPRRCCACSNSTSTSSSRARSSRSRWTQFDEEGVAAARAIKEIFTGPNVKEMAVMIPADRVPFGASVFLVGAMKDGSVLVLRGDVGGMSF